MERAIQPEMGIDESFVWGQIRKYNQARRQIYKDKALAAVGIHTGLLKSPAKIFPELTEEERSRILYFLRQFLADKGVQVELL